MPCTGADRCATQHLLDTNHLYAEHQYEDKGSRHINKTRYNGAGAKNKATTNHGGDKTKDNGFHQVHLQGASQVTFQPHLELHKMKRLFYGPTSSLGISRHEVTKVAIKTLTKKLAKDLTKEDVKTLTGKFAKGETETHTRKLAWDPAKRLAKTKTLAEKLAKDRAKMIAKNHTRRIAKDPAKKYNRDLAKKLAKDLTQGFIKTLTKDNPSE